MKKYRVVIKEISTYAVDVIAKNEDEAETKAFMHPDFLNNNTVDYETVTEEIFENEY